MLSDEKWMRRAIHLAQKGRGRVHPNPMVGAVLVKNGRVVGEGYHRKYGDAHAEIEAIRRAGERARGSTLYTNLEPCSHWGKTPPCATAVLRAGIRRVVSAMQDPNHKVAGRGFQILRRGAVSVTKDILYSDAEHLNRAFVTWVKRQRPYITLKVASSLDGRTATLQGDSKWITGEKARRQGHQIRSQVDAIAVGRQTVMSDNPSLTAHAAGRNPIRIVFDSKLLLSLRSKIFSREAESWCLTTDRAVLRRVDEFKRKGIQLIVCHANRQGRIDVRDALKKLAQRGVAHLLVEGGLTLQHSFIEAGVVDEVIWYVAPLIIGNARTLRQAWRLQQVKVSHIGPDLRITACLPASSRR